MGPNSIGIIKIQIFKNINGPHSNIALQYQPLIIACDKNYVLKRNFSRLTWIRIIDGWDFWRPNYRHSTVCISMRLNKFHPICFRKATPTTAARNRTTGTNSGGMWRFYTDDSPGIKVWVSTSTFRSNVIHNGESTVQPQWFFLQWTNSVTELLLGLENYN